MQTSYPGDQSTNSKVIASPRFTCKEGVSDILVYRSLCIIKRGSYLVYLKHFYWSCLHHLIFHWNHSLWFLLPLFLQMKIFLIDELAFLGIFYNLDFKWIKIILHLSWPVIWLLSFSRFLLISLLFFCWFLFHKCHLQKGNVDTTTAKKMGVKLNFINMCWSLGK